MKQQISGNFVMNLTGFPPLMKAKLNLKSDKGNKASGQGLIIGPFLLGLIKK